MLVDPSKVSKKKLLATCTSPLKPQFYTVKLGFAGVYIIFLISAQNIARGYSLEPPHRVIEAILTSTHNLYFEQQVWKLSEFFIW